VVYFVPDQAQGCRKYDYFQILATQSGAKETAPEGFAQECPAGASVDFKRENFPILHELNDNRALPGKQKQ